MQEAAEAEVAKEQDAILLSAVADGKLATARQALARGASPDAERVEREDNGCWQSTPALYLAAQSGNELMVRLLLKAGANPNAVWKRRGIVDFEEIPCLIAAFPHFEIVRLLLHGGSDPNKPSIWGEDRSNATSPLAHAQNFPEVQKLLLAYSGNTSP